MYFLIFTKINIPWRFFCANPVLFWTHSGLAPLWFIYTYNYLVGYLGKQNNIYIHFLWFWCGNHTTPHSILIAMRLEVCVVKYLDNKLHSLDCETKFIGFIRFVWLILWYHLGTCYFKFLDLFISLCNIKHTFGALYFYLHQCINLFQHVL